MEERWRMKEGREQGTKEGRKGKNALVVVRKSLGEEREEKEEETALWVC